MQPNLSIYSTINGHLGLVPVWGYYKACCCERSCAGSWCTRDSTPGLWKCRVRGLFVQLHWAVPNHFPKWLCVYSLQLWLRVSLISTFSTISSSLKLLIGVIISLVSGILTLLGSSMRGGWGPRFTRGPGIYCPVPDTLQVLGACLWNEWENNHVYLILDLTF